MKPQYMVVLLLSLARPVLSGPEPLTGPRCTYTFILPQQKFTGAVCWNSVHPLPAPLCLNRSEVEELRFQLGRQQAQMDELRRLVEVDRSVVSEVKALRKESRNVNARVTQLYNQLLHEILQRRERPVQTSQLEGQVANASAEALRVAANYRQLEGKYLALAALVNNQSALISRLERDCQQETRGRVHPQPPLVPVVPHNPVNVVNDSRVHLDAINDIQQDQTAPAEHWPHKAPVPLDGTVQPPVLLTRSAGPWCDCQAAQQDGQSSGITVLQPIGARGIIQAWCDQEYDGGGWTIIQRRQDGSVNFFITWQHYKNGFGNLDGEHWLGLEPIHWLTRQSSYVLRVWMEDWSGRQAYAEYDTFALEPESDFYRLRLGHYQGSAGDSLSWHNGRQFSTLDHDHDAYSGNCAHFQKGGWWYNMCAHSNLNGIWYKGGHYRSRYQDGVYWAEFHGGAYSLRKVAMMIRPSQDT
ncbi:angiopoietin-related protein 6 [Rhineura floridana]|uniref:angiopoietin-related protein 6 n=1 Tax=Rhineura floridana TaxID=261503 RepID=UPI002AC7F054|nr:angiopoietin-related protein 6 [Rhineura floridana]XP_061477628.1 angiopoietin-related protein 6 [Rhineura floridana]XP_061477629.1 angiopoietin-related protein 6 [Rhineura floridana]XP_061477630.1 angiopoietin-related protein 6 [Rhineura floridana]